MENISIQLFKNIEANLTLNTWILLFKMVQNFSSVFLLQLFDFFKKLQPLLITAIISMDKEEAGSLRF